MIICTQHTTLVDPYIFHSMKSNLPTGFYEPSINVDESISHDLNQYATRIYETLVNQDVNVKNDEFFDISNYLRVTTQEYIETTDDIINAVEQLIDARGNLLNYVARMMKNDITNALLKGEGEDEKWFETATQESYNTSDSITSTFEPHAQEEEQQKPASENVWYDSSVYEGLPWYLKPIYNKQLVFDVKHRVKGGTKNALIEHLTNIRFSDHWFNIVFLLTFRSIFTPKEFLMALIERYNAYPPDGLSFGQYNRWIVEKAFPTKVRVVSIMNKFLSQYWTSYYYTENLCVLKSFADTATQEDIEGCEELQKNIKRTLLEAKRETGRKDEDKIEKNVFIKKETNPSVATANQSPRKQVGSSFLSSIHSLSTSSSRSKIFKEVKKLELFDITPTTMAQQLSLLEHELYCQITIFECLERVWGKKYGGFGGSPNITIFINGANNLTNFVSYTIVSNANISRRIQIITYFIAVAQYCRDINNFSSMTAIISALYSSPVYRLKKTWHLVPESSKALLRELNTLMDSTKNFIRYRQLLKSVRQVVCVPFFGVYLSDLTFAHTGNPDFLSGSTELINFSKRAKVVEIIEEVINFKKLHYTSFGKNLEVLDFINHSLKNVPHIETQYNLSLNLESRSR